MGAVPQPPEGSPDPFGGRDEQHASGRPFDRTPPIVSSRRQRPSPRDSLRREKHSMSNPIRLALVLHNHQPVGNFDGVIEQAYQDSYLPFLDVFESYSDLIISLHTSGP